MYGIVAKDGHLRRGELHRERMNRFDVQVPPSKSRARLTGHSLYACYRLLLVNAMARTCSNSSSQSSVPLTGVEASFIVIKSSLSHLDQSGSACLITGLTIFLPPKNRPSSSFVARHAPAIPEKTMKIRRHSAGSSGGGSTICNTTLSTMLEAYVNKS